MTQASRLTIITDDINDLLALKQLLTTRKHRLEHDHRRVSDTVKRARAEEVAHLGRLLDGMTIGIDTENKDG